MSRQKSLIGFILKVCSRFYFFIFFLFQLLLQQLYDRASSRFRPKSHLLALLTYTKAQIEVF